MNKSLQEDATATFLRRSAFKEVAMAERHQEETHICQRRADVGHPRFWKITAIVLLILLAAVLAVQARADLPFPERVRARTVEAQEIVLQDADGHVRARFAVQGNTARLVIYDEQGKAVAMLPEKARMKELAQ